jgi:hypothetical protein
MRRFGPSSAPLLSNSAAQIPPEGEIQIPLDPES